jgi:hypothetical protein
LISKQESEASSPAFNSARLGVSTRISYHGHADRGADVQALRNHARLDCGHLLHPFFGRIARDSCPVSTILTSQLPVAKWHEQIGDPSIADSIMDRLVHNAYRIELNGESMRKRGRKPEQDSQ